MNSHVRTPVARLIAVLLALALFAVGCGESDDLGANASTDRIEAAADRAVEQIDAASDAAAEQIKTAAGQTDDASEQAQEIIEDANEQAQEIIEDANEQAEVIIEDANDQPEADGTPLTPPFVASQRDDACDGADKNTDDATGWVAAAAGFCNNEVKVILCPDDQRYFEIRVNEDDRLGDLVFWIDPALRFHPADEIDTAPIELYESIGPPPGAQSSLPIFVLDEDEHGQFISEQIFSMTGQRPQFNKIKELIDGTGMFTESAILDAAGLIDHSSQGGVVNMSFGTFVCDGSPLPVKLIDMISRWAAQYGYEFAASAGNQETDRVRWPAALSSQDGLDRASDALGSELGLSPAGQGGPSVWSVGSTEPGRMTRSCFSNFGDWVTLWFPGEEILVYGDSTLANPTSLRTWSGTSFAAPQAAAWLSAGADLTMWMDPPADPPNSYNIEMDSGWRTKTFCPFGQYSPRNARYLLDFSTIHIVELSDFLVPG